MGSGELFPHCDPVLSPGKIRSDVKTLYAKTFVVTGAQNWISPQRPALGEWISDCRSRHVTEPSELAVMRTVTMQRNAHGLTQDEKKQTVPMGHHPWARGRNKTAVSGSRDPG